MVDGRLAIAQRGGDAIERYIALRLRKAETSAVATRILAVDQISKVAHE